MKIKSKQLASYVYLLITTGVFVFILLTSKDINLVFEKLVSLEKGWIFAAGFSIGLFFFLEAYILQYFFYKQHIGIHFLVSLKIAVIGLYYSCITPSAIGGQPVQVYHFREHGVSIGSSTLALSIKLICYQITVVIFSLLSLVLYHEYINAHLHRTLLVIILGIGINFIPVAFLILLAMRRDLLKSILLMSIKFFHKVRLIKDPKKTADKLDYTMNDYDLQLSFIKGNPKMLLVMFAMTIVQVLSLMGIVCFIYLALGLGVHSMGIVLALQFVLYTSVSFIPLPGASGAQELGFYAYFKAIFTKQQLYIAVLLWRFFTYYLTIIVGTIVIAFESVLSILSKHKTKTCSKKYECRD